MMTLPGTRELILLRGLLKILIEVSCQWKLPLGGTICTQCIGLHRGASSSDVHVF
jgi:hypothetical protein